MKLPVEPHMHFPVKYSAANSLIICVTYFYDQSAQLA